MKELYCINERKSEEDIIAFIQVIEDASSYLFSLNHSQPYSYEGYVSGYLRTHYPLEFLTVAMNINKDKEEKTIALTNYAKKIGIKFNSPKFRHSQSGYFCDKESNSIYKGICSIKFMNEQVANELYDLRDKSYTNFVELLVDIKSTTLNSRQLDILIKINFFEEFGDINQLLQIRDRFDDLYEKRSIKKDRAVELNISEDIIRKYSTNETETRVEEIDYVGYLNSIGIVDIHDELLDCIKYKYDKDELGEKVKIPNGYSHKKIMSKYNISEFDQVKFATKTVIGKFDIDDSVGLIKELAKTETFEKCSLQQRIKYQLEHLGYIEYINPELTSRHIAVTELNTTYSPKFKAYCLKNGQLCEMKIHKKRNPRDKSVKTSFNDVPFEDGDILYMDSCTKKQKQKKNTNGEWEVVPDEFNWWIDSYSKINL